MKILLATDGSEHSGYAAGFLARFNFSPDDEIHVFHAISWIPVITEWEILYNNFREIRDEVVPRILDSTVEALKPVKAQIKTSFREEYPDKGILHAAEEAGADIIVMGARGLRGVGSYIVGSVTKLVAIKSDRPVLIVKSSEKGVSGRVKILFATDGSEHSDAVGRVLSSIPFPAGTELTILNTIPTMFEDIPERFAIEINDRIKNIVAGTRELETKESAKIIEKAYKDLSGSFAKTEKRSVVGDPSTVILQEAESIGADIIAVGTSGMRGLSGMLGSVSRYILNHSKCSVLIGKG